jgi:hypothetical protein
LRSAGQCVLPRINTRCTNILMCAYSKRQPVNRAFCPIISHPRAKNCFSVYSTVAVARSCVVSLVQPASRHGVGGLRHLLWVLEMQPAPTTRRTGFLTFNLTSLYIALAIILLATPTATISMPCASEPPCAVDSVSLLRGSKTSFYHSRTQAHTQLNETTIYRKRWAAQLD